MNNNVSEYAISLFALGQEKGLIGDYADSLALVKESMTEHPQYLSLLHSPALSMEERLHLIDEAFGDLKAEDVLSFLKLLCEKGQIQTLPNCINNFFDLVKDAENKVLVKVFFAEELSEEQKNRLYEKLSKKTGKNLEVVYEQDPSLIGGVRIQMDDLVLDGSLSGRLNTIKGALEK